MGPFPPIQETRRYVQKVLRYYRAFRTTGILSATMASALRTLPVSADIPNR